MSQTGADIMKNDGSTISMIFVTMSWDKKFHPRDYGF